MHVSTVERGGGAPDPEFSFIWLLANNLWDIKVNNIYIYIARFYVIIIYMSSQRICIVLISTI